MKVTLRNATGKDALGSYALTDRFRVGDAVSETVMTVAPKVYKLVNASGPVTLAINCAKFAIGLPALEAKLREVWNLPSGERSGTLVPAGQTKALDYDSNPHKFIDVAKPSFWADRVGDKRMTILVQSPYGSVEFGVNASNDCERVVTPMGVRDGLDPNDGNQHLHRWGEGGYYAGYDTATGPSVMALSDNKFHLFYQAAGSPSICHLISGDGLQWTPASPLVTPATTTGGHCATMYRGQIWVLFRNPHGVDFYGSWSPDGQNLVLGGPTYLAGDGHPTATEFNGYLCMVVVDAGGKAVMWARYDPTTGAWSHGDTGMRTSASPCIVSFRGQIRLYYRDAHGDGIMYATSNDGATWTGVGHILNAATGRPDYTCSNGPRAVVYKNQLKLFFQDASGNGILCLTSNDGYQFTPEPDWYVGLNTRGEFSAACLNDRVCIAVEDPNGNGVFTLVPELQPLNVDNQPV